MTNIPLKKEKEISCITLKLKKFIFLNIQLISK